MQSKISTYNKKLEYQVRYSKDEKLHEYLNQLSTKLVTLSDLFLLQSYQLNIAQKSASHLRSILQSTSDEIEYLENEAVEEQFRIKEYNPDLNDQVDVAVSKIISDLGRPLTVGVVRIEAGIYRFGEKRIKIDQNDSRIRGNFYLAIVDGRSEELEDYLINL